MELVDGETLAEEIAPHPGGLQLEDALSIVRQIAAALATAHEEGPEAHRLRRDCARDERTRVCGYCRET